MEDKLIKPEILKLAAVCITWGTAAINLNTGKLGQSLLVQIQPHQLWRSQAGAGNAPAQLWGCLTPCGILIVFAGLSVGRTGHKQAVTCSWCQGNSLWPGQTPRSSPALADGTWGEVPTLSRYQRSWAAEKWPELFYNSKSGVRPLAAECLLASCSVPTTHLVPAVLLPGKSCLLGKPCMCTWGTFNIAAWVLKFQGQIQRCFLVQEAGMLKLTLNLEVVSLIRSLYTNDHCY